MVVLRRLGPRLRFRSRLYTSSSSSGKQTHFGFQTVDENEKSQKVYGVFENVASRYDLMNDVMSFGIHRFWKDRFVTRLNPTSNIRLLDVAGGTGRRACWSVISCFGDAEREGRRFRTPNCPYEMKACEEKDEIAAIYDPHLIENRIEKRMEESIQFVPAIVIIEPSKPGDIAFRVLRYIDYKTRQSGTSTSYFTKRADSDIDWSVPGITGPTSSSCESGTVSDSTSTSQSTTATEETASAEHCPVTVCDINQAMLDVGQRRALDLGVEGIRWVLGDAEKLPFSDNEFDAYTIAFGIRNCTHIDEVLKEAYRVLKRGGRFMCLEFSQVWAPGVSSLYDWYSFQVIPVMGQIFASDWKSYQYLVESIRQFPNQDQYAAMIRDAGFRFVTYENLSCGIVAIHSGFKL